MPSLLTEALTMSDASRIELNITPVSLENKLCSIPLSTNNYTINFREERFECWDTRADQC